MKKITLYNRTPDILSMSEALELAAEIEDSLEGDGVYIMGDCAVERRTLKKGIVYYVSAGKERRG